MIKKTDIQEGAPQQLEPAPKRTKKKSRGGKKIPTIKPLVPKSGPQTTKELIRVLNLEITMVDPKSLIPDANNPRRHSDDHIIEIASSIKKFGFNDPVGTDGRGGIIEGHGRTKAGILLEMPLVPTINLGHMTQIEQKAYLLAHNRIAENSSWSIDGLRLSLQELNQESFQMAVLGWTPEDLTSLMELETMPASEGNAPHVPPTRITIKCEAGDHSDMKQVIEETLSKGGFGKYEVL